MKKITSFAVVAFLAAFAIHAAPGETTIRIGSGHVQLHDNDHVTGVRGDEPFIVQFREIPNEARRAALRARGVVLDGWVGGNAYVVRCDPACVSWLPDDDSVRASTKISPEMKRSRVFDTDAGLAGRIQKGLPLDVDLVFYDGVSFERAASLLRDHGIDVGQHTFGFRTSISATTTWKIASELLLDPEVRWIEPSVPEAIPETINAGERVRADQVREQYGFLGADGSGVNVGIWDWFPEAVHTDLEDRVTWIDVIPGQLSHGQLVSGVVAGAGLLNHRAKGIAPKAALYWNTCDRNTAWSDMRAAKSEYGITIVNNSWGVAVGWWADPDDVIPSWENNVWAWGYYHELAAGADELVRDDDLLVVFATGNARGYGFLGPHLHSGVPRPNALHEDVHPSDPEYTSISGAAVAKNVFTVGYVSKDEVVASPSGWGPTSDGRIKPDVVAPGVDLFVTDEDDGYSVASGSSLSSPVVAGSAALLTDYWQRRRGDSPSSLELKNLLVHSARDLGNPGPDYSYGFGLIDDELAARIIDAASAAPQNAAAPASERSRKRGVRRPETSSPVPTRATFELGDLDNGQSQTVPFVVGDHSPTLRATLAWYDPPADHLVNDLDLRLVAPDGSVVRPFVLDPSHPSADATHGRNSVDDVESAVVEHPAAGTWSVVVEGTRVSMAPQRYSLIVSAVAENAPLLIHPEGKCEIYDFFLTKDDEFSQTPTPFTTFSAGDPLNVFLAIGLPKNADYGDYYGLVGVDFVITNTQGDVVVSHRDDTHQLAPFERIDEIATGATIPDGLPKGPYSMSFTIRLRNGQECEANAAFSVE